jgi:hypothetical protein
MNELALFAGAGGGILGGHLLGWRTVCAVEYNAFARSVLLARQNDGTFPPFPIWDDVRTFDGRPSPAALTRKSGKSRENDRIDHAVMASDGGQLNPEWVEWLMGWPIGLTALKPLETDKFREWQQQHSICSREVKNAA